MKRISLSLIVFAALAVALSAAPTLAGVVEDRLQERIDAADADDAFRVFIRPTRSVDALAFQVRLAASHPTRRARHAAAMSELKRVSAVSQPPIVGDLVSLGVARSRINTFWIDNLIEADLTAAQIAEIAARPDVEEIVAVPSVVLIEPIINSTAKVAGAITITQALAAVKAPEMWAMGYTGQGRLVASIDTGVDGLHSYLAPTWRGNNGYPISESWFDPTFESDTVKNYGQGGSFGHGTLVMGLMVGHSTATGDTLGVAPGAQWISTATIDVTEFAVEGPPSIVEALQWLADPDGDPNTVGDVPDVINNSWGIPTNIPNGYECEEMFWNAIDNVEALGAAMIFAAGNEGQSGARSIRNPGNRPTSETNAFAVGMVESQAPFTIDSRSSTGPSECDLVSTKPELVAPGVQVVSTYPDERFANADGTSFSTPLVCGAIALLRQARPNATAEEIKLALLNSAADLGPAGNDNEYGYGMLDIPAALALIPESTTPHVELFDADYTRPAPSESGTMTCILRAFGAAVSNVSMTMTSLDSRLTITTGTSAFGAIAKNDTASNSAQPFAFTLSAAPQPGERLAVQFQITADGGYSRTFNGIVQVGPESLLDVVTHTAGNFTLSIISNGTFGGHINSITGRPGALGYLYPKDTDTLTMFEGGLLVGTDSAHISDNIRGQLEPVADFVTDPGGRLQMSTGPIADEQSRCAYHDNFAGNPLGLYIVQETFVYSDTTIDDFVTVQYTIHNTSGGAINGLRAGLFFDWDFPWGDGGADWGGFHPEVDMGFMQHNVVERNQYRGVAVLNREGATSYRLMDNSADVYFDPPNAEGIDEGAKARWLSEGFQRTAPEVGDGDASHIIATGPFDVPVGDSITVAFAIIGATNEDELVTFTRRARFEYDPVFPAIALSSDSLQFHDHGPGASDGYLSIDNIGFEELTWSVDTDSIASWLSVSPVFGAVADSNDTPDQLTVSVDASALADGDYVDTLVITSNDFNQTRHTAVVRLNKAVPGFASITPLLGPFEVSTTSAPTTQRLTVNNIGSQRVFHFLPDTIAADWLTLTRTGFGFLEIGQQPDTLMFSVDPGGLEPGLYTDTVIIPILGGTESFDWYIPVTLRVLTPAILAVDADSLYFTAETGTSSPPDQSFMIRNEGGSSLDWTITGPDSWLSTMPTSGSLGPAAVDIVTVSVSLGDLDSNVFHDTITVTASGVDGSPHTVRVVFDVTAPDAPEFDHVLSAPNPFTPGDENATFYGLPAGADVLIRVYDLAGEEVATVLDGSVSGTPEWNGATDDGDVVAVGVYLAYVEIRSGGGDLPRKQMLKVAVAK